MIFRYTTWFTTLHNCTAWWKVGFWGKGMNFWTHKDLSFGLSEVLYNTRPYSPFHTHSHANCSGFSTKCWPAHKEITHTHTHTDGSYWSDSGFIVLLKDTFNLLTTNSTSSKQQKQTRTCILKTTKTKQVKSLNCYRLNRSYTSNLWSHSWIQHQVLRKFIPWVRSI